MEPSRDTDDDSVVRQLRCYDCDNVVSLGTRDLDTVREFLRAHSACATEPWPAQQPALSTL